MYINLINLREVFVMGYAKFTLPSNIIRYVEFENVAVFLLDENKSSGIGGITSKINTGRENEKERSNMSKQLQKVIK